VDIADFDVEPVISPRFWAVVLGIVGAVSGVLAIIGWPVPVVSGRGSAERHAWARTVEGIQDWVAHDGWRMSGTSWIYGAFAVAALAGVAVLLHPSWSGNRSLFVVVGPAGVLLVLGPVAQWAFGVPWSNYGHGSTGAVAIGILVTVTGGAVLTGIRQVLRRPPRSEDDPNPPPRGVL